MDDIPSWVVYVWGGIVLFLLYGCLLILGKAVDVLTAIHHRLTRDDRY